MKPFIKWISAKELMDRWETQEAFSIVSAVKDGLICFEKVHVSPFDKKWGTPAEQQPKNRDRHMVDAGELEERYERADLHLHNIIFQHEDVIDYETKKGDVQLTGQERTELGRLRMEKKKWEASIEVAIYLACYCEKAGRVKRSELMTEYRKRFSDRKIYTDVTFDKIWKMVPHRLKFTGGTH